MNLDTSPEVLRLGFLQQAHHRGKTRIANHIGQGAVINRHGYAYRFEKHVLGQLDHAGQLRRTARQDDARRQQIVIPRLADDLLHQAEQFLDPRLDDGAQGLTRQLSRAPVAQSGNLDSLVLTSQHLLGHAKTQLDFFCVGIWRAQCSGNIARDLVARNGYDRSMPNRAARVDGHIGGTAADVDQYDAEFLFVCRQACLARGDGLQDQVLHFEAAAAHALDDVLSRADRPGDDMHPDFQADAAHADRLADVLLAVDDVLLR